MLHILTLDALPLTSGEVLHAPTIAWAQYGPSPEQARRVCLLLHGITSSQYAFIGEAASVPDQGWLQAWADQGPFDLNRDCVLAPNTLGSCYGTSGPNDSPLENFPAITIADAVCLYAQWLQRLALRRIDVVLGYSYGGYQAFAWSLTPPVTTGCVAILASAPKGRGSIADVNALDALAWRWDQGDPQAREQWLAMRVASLQHDGVADWLNDTAQDASPAALHRLACAWAQHYRPHTLATLRRAAVQFDVRAALCERGPAMPVLWMVNRTDPLFASLTLPGPAPRQLTRIAIHGKYGHASPLLQAPLWTAQVKDLIEHAVSD